MIRRLLGVMLAMLVFAGNVGAHDKRVVALGWEAAEHLLKLDVTPLAIADARDYRAWVVRPTLPDTVIDIGSRTEPNLELLARLKPELIVIPPLLADMRPVLERIAPVESYDSFATDADNYALQRHNYERLARRLGREDLARRRLDEMDAHILDLRRQLFEHFAGNPPKVTVIRFSSTTAVFINTANSMVQRAMDLLHLQPAYPLPASPWGINQTSIATLGAIRDGVVLHIEPFAQQEQLFATSIWQAMPFVRAGHFGALPSTWTYSGVFSVEYLAQSITEALLRLEPDEALARAR